MTFYVTTVAEVSHEGSEADKTKATTSQPRYSICMTTVESGQQLSTMGALPESINTTTEPTIGGMLQGAAKQPQVPLLVALANTEPWL